MTVFVGGIALNDPNKISDFNATNAYVIRNMILADAIKLIRSIIVQRR